jgi:dTDP-4-dehydrorhamnose reductase
MYVAMARTLVTGASGLLGAMVWDRLRAAGHAAVPCHHSRSRYGAEPLDITDSRSVAEVFDRTRPELVVHCAGLANVALCEDDPKLAWLVNARGTELVVEQAARYDARVVHVSTDWVFPGTGCGGYCENDPPRPLQVYGQTKLAAEQVVTREAASLVVRVPLLYSLVPWPRQTWPTQTLDRLSRGETVLADDVEVRQPAMTVDIANCLVALIGQGASGVFHIVPAQTCTKFAWSRLLARSVGLPEGLVRPGPRSDRPHRPLRATLCARRLAEWDVPPPRGVSEVAATSREELVRRLSSASQRAAP